MIELKREKTKCGRAKSKCNIELFDLVKAMIYICVNAKMLREGVIKAYLQFLDKSHNDVGFLL